MVAATVLDPEPLYSSGSCLARRIRCLQRGETIEPTEPLTTVVATLIG